MSNSVQAESLNDIVSAQVKRETALLRESFGLVVADLRKQIADLREPTVLDDIIVTSAAADPVPKVPPHVPNVRILDAMVDEVIAEYRYKVPSALREAWIGKLNAGWISLEDKDAIQSAARQYLVQAAQEGKLSR